MSSIHDVRYFDSQMTGAPVKDGLYGAGKLLQIFDACLVNGFNVRAVTQIVVSDGIATATTADADHGYRDYTVIRVWGCTENDLNGDWKSSVIAGNTFSWPTTVADGTYGGTISAKTAPLGWSKPFSSGKVAVFRPATGLRHYFRVDDTSSAYCYVSGYEDMTGTADAGTNPFPTQTQVASGVSFNRHSPTYIQRWFLVGDGKTVYLIFSAEDTNGILIGTSHDYNIHAFGEINTFTPGDVGSSFVAGSIGANNNVGHSNQNGLNFPGIQTTTTYTYGGFYLARPSSQVTGAPVRARTGGSALVTGWGSSFDANGRTPSPNPADLAELFHYPVLIQEETSRAIRGEIRGLWQPLTTGSLANVGTVFDIDGRKILIVRGPDASVYLSSTTNRTGTIGVDITGPW